MFASSLGDAWRSMLLCRTTITVTGVADVVQLFTSENISWVQLLPEVVNLLRLYLTLPVTSCTADRRFSSLRRLKTFLRSTVTQKRLNHIAVLHTHREQHVDLEEMCNNLILKNQTRQSAFAVFPK